MTLELIDIQTAKKIEPFYALEVKVSENLSTRDYHSLVPIIDTLLRNQSIRLLLLLDSFNGWNAGALWEDTKFADKNFDHIDRIAIVGEQYGEEGRNIFCRPFTKADVRYYNSSEIEDARKWILQRTESDFLESSL
jgi:hypothetical protein